MRKHLAQPDRLERSAALINEAAEILRRAARLIESGDVAAAREAQREAYRLATRGLSAAEKDVVARPNVAFLAPGALPRREVVIQAVTDLGRPAPVPLVASYTEARYGKVIDPAQFASLRRDERRAWKSKTSRSVYLVAALDTLTFAPVRGLVASSIWEDWVRFIGPRSRRVDQLQLTINLANQADWLATVDPKAAERVGQLVRQAAATVPGVDTRRSGLLSLVAKAAAAELAQLEAADRHVREEAAARAAGELPEETRLFGTA